jgi:hypothetical protein
MAINARLSDVKKPLVKLLGFRRCGVFEEKVIASG